MSVDPVLALTLRLVLAGLFATAAAAKLRRREAFEGIVANYRLLPPALVAPFARLLPWAELVTAGLLLLPATARLGALAAGLLLAVFAAAMAINILRGRTAIDCGCFVGFTRQRIGWSLVVRNLLLVGACGVLLLPPAARPLGAFDLFTVAAATTVLLAGYAALSALLELPHPGEGR